MKKGTMETAVGVFVLIGIACIAYLAVQLGRMDWLGNNYYPVYALFTSVSGLKNGAAIELAGVDIGQVGAIELDQKSDMAKVTLEIRNGIRLDSEIIVSVKTAGLIGDKFIKITPGGSDKTLKKGATIMDTESAIDIEDLISKFVFGKV